MKKDIEKRIMEGRKDKFKGIKYAADMVIITKDEKILLVQRGHYPFGYALPGGHVDSGENPEEAAWRELKEETGLDKNNIKSDIIIFKYIGKFDKINRDPRGRMISDAYLVYIKKKAIELHVKGMDDAVLARWTPKKTVEYLIKNNKGLTQKEKDEMLIQSRLQLEDILAFDHCDIIEKALKLYKEH